jgi:hypothetical protein
MLHLILTNGKSGVTQGPEFGILNQAQRYKDPIQQSFLHSGSSQHVNS